MSSDQVNAEPGNVPCSASLADPENEMVSPTLQVTAGPGEVIDAVGAVWRTLIRVDVDAVPPLPSPPFSRTVPRPVEYVDCTVEAGGPPSRRTPPRSQA